MLGMTWIMALIQDMLNLLKMPSETFTLEDTGCIPVSPSYSTLLADSNKYAFWDESENSDDLYDSSDSEGQPSPSSSMGSLDISSSELRGLSNRHRNQRSMMVMAGARAHAPENRIRPPPKTKEEIAFRELHLQRKDEKRQLAAFRKGVEVTMQTYHTAEWFSPRLEWTLSFASYTETLETRRARLSNVIWLQKLLADVIDYDGILAQSIESFGLEARPAALIGRHRCDQKSLFKRVRRLLDCVELLFSERNAQERARLKELARARFRKDSILAQ